jgi:CubicO group peptidase (beta-lactamase class C family)
MAAGCSRRGEGGVAAAVDSLAEHYRAEQHVPGLSVAVVHGRDTLALRGYGLADVENGVPATAATVYPVASLTKQFTAAAVMRLVHEKRLSLDDEVGRWLPDLPAAWRRIPVRALLNHTAGLPEHAVLMREDVPPDSVLALAAHDPPAFAPGTRWSYSNTGYLVLGRLIERVTGDSYERYLEDEVLRPAGLAATRPCDPEPVIPHRAAGYFLRDTTVVNAPRDSPVPLFAAGSLCSTAGDLAAWNRALATGRVVSPASFARMTTPEGAARQAGYGYGLIVGSIGGHRVYAHSGEMSGFRSFDAYLPDDSLSVVVLTNLASASADPLGRDIIRAVLATSARR